jgi:hypothetical protein
MPLIGTEQLSIDKITDYWSLEIKPPISRDELLHFLQAAWWRGELNTGTKFTRLTLLQKMFKSARENYVTGVVFVTKIQQRIESEDEIFYLNDLEKLRIPVPSDSPETWTEASCAEAFETLAQAPSGQHYSDRTIQFLMMKIDYRQFAGLLTAHGIDLPSFWRPPIEKTLTGGKQHTQVTAAVRRRGRKPEIMNRVKEDMKRDIREGRYSPADLQAMREKKMATTYDASRDTARKALAAVLSEIVEKSNSDK